MRTGYVVIGDFVCGQDEDGDVTTEMTMLWAGKSCKAAKRIAAAIALDPGHQLSTALLPAMSCFYQCVDFTPFEYKAEAAAKVAQQLVRTNVLQVRDHVPRAVIKSFEVKNCKYRQAMPQQCARPVPKCSIDAPAEMNYVRISPELQCFDLPNPLALEK